MSNFLQQFWKEKKRIGAMAPSSRFLAQKMLENINFDQDQVIIELGPGTGVFTEKLLSKMTTGSHLLVFEVNDNFYAQLKQQLQDDRLILIHDSAEKLDFYLAKYHLEKAHVVLSSLPLANFPETLTQTILKASKDALLPNGKYIQFQYSLQAKKEIETIFGEAQISFTPLNFPPAFVYTCTKTA
jgi:phosphatidylethanolamine/phosphatidyl-N-methylethanolamine N-methyltransferase